MPTRYPTKDGVKWRAVVKINGARVATKMFGAGMEEKRAAIQWENETRKQFLLEETPMGLPDSLQWASKYLEYAEQKYARQTFKEKHAVFKLFFKFTQETRLDRVTPNMAMDYLKEQNKARSGNAANKDRKNLAAAWEWGRKFIDGFPSLQNPFLAVPQFKADKTPRYVPAEADFWKVVGVANGQDRAMLLAFFFLGARRGEVFRLRWEDVDFLAHRVRLGTRKTRNGDMRYDWVPMPETLRDALQDWQKKRPFKTEWVFSCLDDSPSPHHNPGERYRARGRFMKKMCERAGVKPFGFHALRHLHASLLYNEGAELSVVQRQLRHTNPNTTARYLRSLGYEEEHSQKVLAVLEGRGRGKVIPFPQKQNPQSSRSRGSVHNNSTQPTTNLKANGV